MCISWDNVACDIVFIFAWISLDFRRLSRDPQRNSYTSTKVYSPSPHVDPSNIDGETGRTAIMMQFQILARNSFLKRRSPIWNSHYKARWSHNHADGYVPIRLPKEKASSERNTNIRIFRTLLQHVWPQTPTSNNLEEQEKVKLRKRRVLFSVGLMVGGKAVTIQVPFLLKHLVDSLSPEALVATASDPNIAAMPVALLLGYGVSRAASSGLQEWRNAVFAHVAQDTIRSVGEKIFDHVHQLDMQFHLSRSTGHVSRVLDRGQRSISFVLNALVFNGMYDIWMHPDCK